MRSALNCKVEEPKYHKMEKKCIKRVSSGKITKTTKIFSLSYLVDTGYPPGDRGKLFFPTL